METVTLIIDGKEVTGRKGQSVLDCALENQIYIPHLCHHPDLPELESCRLCLVEYKGEIVPGCTLEVEDGMSVITNSDSIKRKRQTSMELILAAHPEECSTCPKYGQCELQTLMQYLGVSPERMRRRTKTITSDDRNPLLEHDMTRCVLCGRCVRACQNVRGVGVMDYRRSGEEYYTGPEERKLLTDADCRFCGACIAVCPTGAIRDKLEACNPEMFTVPCENTCPAGTNIPEYIRLVKQGDYGRAAAVIHQKLPIPKSLGLICSHPCESACKRNCLNEGISIRNLKRTAVENDQAREWKSRQKQLPASGKTVAVIGAGPCGLTAAFYLSKQGHKVTVLEKEPVPGGMLKVGIPPYRLPGEVVDEEVEFLQETGFEIRCGERITDVSELSNVYDAVLVAVGAGTGNHLPIEGNDAAGVHLNTEFLRKVNLDEETGIGERVLVLGGGNVAFDCARSAVRLGAKQVAMACLEDEETIPGDREEIEQAQEEGIQIYYAKSFKEVLTTDGHATGVLTEDVESMRFDENRRMILDIRPDSEAVIPADTVIFTVGQHPDEELTAGFKTVRRFYIVTDERGETEKEGVFAAGDVVYGTNSVVKAVAAGRDAASEIDRYLGGDGNIEEQLVDIPQHDPYIGRIEGFSQLKREKPELADVKARKHSFMQVEQTLSCEKAGCEASRCLQCDLRLDLSQPKTWNDYSGGEA